LRYTLSRLHQLLLLENGNGGSLTGMLGAMGLVLSYTGLAVFLGGALHGSSF
jgi:hypothetical protein